MSKEFIGVRIDKTLYDSIVYIRSKTGMSITHIVVNALLDYINKVKLDSELERLKIEIDRERKREENRKLLRGLTLINNQKKLIEKLRRQGIDEETLSKYIEALKEEAQLYGLTLDIDKKSFNIKVVGNVNI